MSEPERVPAHWRALDPQPFDVIEAWGLNFALGNVVKYVARADRRASADLGLEDLRKALVYLNREIAARRNRAAPETR